MVVAGIGDRVSFEVRDVHDESIVADLNEGVVVEEGSAGTSRAGADDMQYLVELACGNRVWVKRAHVCANHSQRKGAAAVQLDDDDDDDDLVIVSELASGVMAATTSGTQAPGKRRHAPDAEANGHADAGRSPDENICSDNFPESDAAPSQEPKRRKVSAPATGTFGSLHSDGSDDVIAGSSQAATAAAAARRAAERKWGPAPRSSGAGQVKKIQLINFSCHANFEIAFNENVTIVHGANGSGKTSIIDALQICLGAKGKETSRATTLGKMIKHGCSEAVAKVTVWNTGVDSERYQFDNLGHYFTVVRKIKANSSAVHLEDQHGRVWKSGLQSPAADVQSMLQFLSINCSSPAVVLNQEKAKTLLSMKGESQEKQGRRFYGLYTKALQLDVAQENLAECKAQLDVQTIKLHNKREGIKTMKTTIDTLKQQRDVYTKGEQMRLAGDLLFRYNKWDCIRDTEMSVQDAENVVMQLEDESEDGTRAGLLRNKEQSNEEAVDLQRQYQQANEQFEQNTAEGETWSQRISDKSAEVKAQRKRVQTLQRQRHMISGDLQSKENEVAALKVELDRLSQSEQAGRNEALENWRQQRDVLDNQVKASQRDTEHAQTELNIQRALLKQAQDAKAVEDEAVRAAEYEVNALRNRVRTTQQSQQGRLTLFGGEAAGRLRDMVDANRGAFDRLPIGPVGVHLTLRSQTYPTAVEQAVGGLFNSWLVHSSRDRQTLLNMSRQINFRAFNVIQTNFDLPRHHWQPRDVPAPPLVTALDELVYDGPHADIIHNVLVDHGKAERIVMCADEAAGLEVLRSCLDQWRSGAICQVYTNHPPKLMQKSGNSEQIYGLNPHANRLVADVQAYLATLNEQLGQVEAAYHAAKASQQAARAQEMEVRRAIGELERTLRASMGAKQRLLQEVQHWSQQRPEDESEIARVRDENLSDLTTAINELRAQLADVDAQLGPLEEREEQLFRELEDLKLGKANARDNLEAQAKKLSALRKEIQVRTRSYRDADEQLKQIDELLRTKREELVLLKKDLAELWAGLDQTLSAEEMASDLAGQLEELWPHVADRSDGSLDELLTDNDGIFRVGERMVARADNMLAKLERQHDSGSLAALNSKIEKFEIKYQLQLRNYNSMNALLETAKAHVQNRAVRYATLTDTVTDRVKAQFRSNMKTKGYGWAGSLELVPEKQELVITVQRPEDKKDGRQPASKAIDLKILSGGERSFTLTMLMLAMGSELGSPFFVMDEYDVFLDSLARRTSTRQLFTFAAHNQGVQYIFCTPQDPRPLKTEFDNLRAASRAGGSQEGAHQIPENLVVIKSMPPPRAGAAV